MSGVDAAHSRSPQVATGSFVCGECGHPVEDVDFTIHQGDTTICDVTEREALIVRKEAGSDA